MKKLEVICLVETLNVFTFEKKIVILLGIKAKEHHEEVDRIAGTINGAEKTWEASICNCRSGPRFAKYLNIYHTTVITLS